MECLGKAAQIAQWYQRGGCPLGSPEPEVLGITVRSLGRAILVAFRGDKEWSGCALASTSTLEEF